MPKQDGALTDVLDELKDAAGDTSGGKVRIGHLVDALDERGYGPALAILPLIEISPIGGIPGVPSLLALTLGLLTVRMLRGYEHFWVPNWLRRREVDPDRVTSSIKWLTPITKRIDDTLHQRLSRFAGRMGQRAACIVILCLLATAPPLEVIPFATTAPMIVIAFFGLGLLFRDGLLMLLGFVGAVVAAGVVVWALLGGS